MDVRELSDLSFKSSMILCADSSGNELATGDWRPIHAWFIRYQVELAQVIPFIPDRPPDVIEPDNHTEWWQLENGVMLATYGEDPYSGGMIIPPDAEDPPPIKDFMWLDHSRDLHLVPSLDPIDSQPE